MWLTPVCAQGVVAGAAVLSAIAEDPFLRAPVASRAREVRGAKVSPPARGVGSAFRECFAAVRDPEPARLADAAPVVGHEGALAGDEERGVAELCSRIERFAVHVAARVERVAHAGLEVVAVRAADLRSARAAGARARAALAQHTRGLERR